MKDKVKQKYNLLTSICIVVGTVIGSGIFFRNEAVLAAIGGNMWIGILAWGIGGLIIMASAYVFAVLATRYEATNGLVGYSEILVGKPYGYLFGWFLATMLYPTVGAILAWVSARFTVILFGWEASPEFSGQTYMLALFYLIAIYSINALSPKLSGKFQVSTTFIKVIPLIAMGVVGTIAGLINGTTLANLGTDYVPEVTGNPFLIALVATVFAYLGWDTVVVIASEVKNPKKNLPIALVGGISIIIIIYSFYFIGIFSAAPIAEIVGGEGVRGAFASVFGAVGTSLFFFIVISCLGTLNGIVVGGQRTYYSLSLRKRGFKPELVSQIDQATNVPNNSAVLFLLTVAIWMVAYGGNFAGWYGDFFFDMPGLVPITFMGFLIPLYGAMFFKNDLGVFNRFVAPALAIVGALFLIYAVIYNQGIAVIWYLLVFVMIMAIGGLFYIRK